MWKYQRSRRIDLQKIASITISTNKESNEFITAAKK